MRKAETLMAVALVLGAGVLLREALRLPIRWTDVGPGAGFFPFWLALGVSICAVIVFLQSLRAPAAASSGKMAFIPAGAWKPLLIVFLPMAAVVALIDSLGIYIGGALYLGGYTWLVGRHRWVTVVLVSVLVPLVLFFLFEKWFLLPMPKGRILEYLLYER
jgi:hypothetical protein